eukprot:scaffold143_cov260-Pinguiococcus_pyrenoidosus.AAC.59
MACGGALVRPRRPGEICVNGGAGLSDVCLGPQLRRAAFVPRHGFAAGSQGGRRAAEPPRQQLARHSSPGDPLVVGEIQRRSAADTGGGQRVSLRHGVDAAGESDAHGDLSLHPIYGARDALVSRLHLPHRPERHRRQSRAGPARSVLVALLRRVLSHHASQDGQLGSAAEICVRVRLVTSASRKGRKDARVPTKHSSS